MPGNNDFFSGLDEIDGPSASPSNPVARNRSKDFFSGLDEIDAPAAPVEQPQPSRALSPRPEMTQEEVSLASRPAALVRPMRRTSTPAPEPDAIRGGSVMEDYVREQGQRPLAVVPDRTDSALPPRLPGPDGTAVDENGVYRGPTILSRTPRFERAYNLATPDQRAMVADQDDYQGTVARALQGDYASRPRALSRSPRVEDRAVDIAARTGAAPNVAYNAARVGERQGTAVGDEVVGNVDKSEFDFETARDARDDDPLSRGVRKGASQLRSSAYGGVRAAGDALSGIGQATGLDPLTEFGNRLAHGAILGRRESQRYEEAIGSGKDPYLGFLEDAVAGAIRNAPGLLARVASGSAKLALTSMGVDVFGDSYAEGRERGLNAGDAATRAASMAVAEIIGEKISFGAGMQAVRAAVRSDPLLDPIKEFTKYVTRELPGEQLTTLLQFDIDKNSSVGLTPNATNEDLLRAIRDTFIQTIGQTAVMGAGLGGAGALARRYNTPERVIAREIDRAVEGSTLDGNVADRIARQSLNPNARNDVDATFFPPSRTPQADPPPKQPTVPAPDATVTAGNEEPDTPSTAVPVTPPDNTVQSRSAGIRDEDLDNQLLSVDARAAATAVETPEEDDEQRGDSRRIPPPIDPVERQRLTDEARVAIAAQLKVAPETLSFIQPVDPTEDQLELQRGIETLTGARVIWANLGTNGRMIGTDGVDLGVKNGVAHKNTILVGAHVTSPFRLLGHELEHVLEFQHPDLHKILKEAVFGAVGPNIKKNFFDLLNNAVLAEQTAAKVPATGVGKAEFESEMTAEGVSDVMDPKMWKSIFSQIKDPKMVDRLVKVIDNFIDAFKQAFRGRRYVKDAQKAQQLRDTVHNVYREWYVRTEASRQPPAPAPVVNAQATQPVQPQAPPAGSTRVSATTSAPAGAQPSTAAQPSLSNTQNASTGFLQNPPSLDGGNGQETSQMAGMPGAASSSASAKASAKPVSNDVQAGPETPSGAGKTETVNTAVPPDRRRKVFLGKKGGRDVVFPDAMHAELFDYATALKDAAKTGRTDVIAQAARLRDHFNFDALGDNGVYSNAANYRRQVIEASRGVKEDGAVEAPQVSFDRLLSDKGDDAGDLFLLRLANSTFKAFVDEDPKGVVDDYIRQFGRNVNTDNARELHWMYRDDPQNFAAAVHEGSSNAAQMVYDNLLESAKPGDSVLFMAGGGGSGKGHILDREGLNTPDRIIYDAVLGKFKSASARIDQALNAGLPVEIAYVNTPALQAFKNALNRAVKKGRTVPLTVLAEAHTGASNTIRQLNDAYKDRAKITIYNWGGTTGKIEDVPTYNQDDLVAQFRAELDTQVKNGYDPKLADAFRRTSFARGLREDDSGAPEGAGSKRPAVGRARSGAGAGEGRVGDPARPRQPAEEREVPPARDGGEAASGDRGETRPDDKGAERAARGAQESLEKRESSLHVLSVERNERVTDKNASLTPEEKELAKSEAEKHGLKASEIEEVVRGHKIANPESDGWAPLNFTGIDIETDPDTGKPTGKWSPRYQNVPYGFNAEDGKALEKGSKDYKERVLALARRMVGEVRQVYERSIRPESKDKALNKDTDAAKKIIAQSGWYKVMRARLRQEFGGLGDLFADLLGATSPNTPVRDNWTNAVDVLRRAMRGDFDALMPKWVAWVEAVEEGETRFRAWFDAQLAKGKAFEGDLKDAREARDAFPAQHAKQGDPMREERARLREEMNAWLNGANERGTTKKAAELTVYYRDRAERVVELDKQLSAYTQAAAAKLPEYAKLKDRVQRLTAEASKYSKASITETPEYKKRAEAMSALREMPEELLPTKESGKKYGFNGRNAVRALVDLWRTVKAADADIRRGGTAPKALNFSGNLIGFRERATIDVWAARLLQRISGLLRIPSMAEGSVSGNMLPGGETTLAFGFGQDVFSEVVKLIRSDAELRKNKDLAEINDDDLQALVWFIEKEIWTRNNWTSAAGEDGSFEFESDMTGNAQQERIREARRVLKSTLSTDEERKAAQAELDDLSRTVDRYVAGASIQTSVETQGESYVPSDPDMARFGESLRTAAYSTDDGTKVLGSKFLSTQGRYGNIERSIDLEVLAREGYDPSKLMLELLKQAQTYKQDAVFLSKVLREKEDYDPLQHRPGVEIYFREMGDLEQLQSTLEALKEKGVGYYTVIVDGRRSPDALAGKMPPAVGVRFQYLPEFGEADERAVLEGMSDEQLSAHIEQKADELDDLARQIRRDVPNVSFAGMFWYATDVRFATEYEGAIDALTDGQAGEKHRSSREAAWTGRSLREGLAGAAGNAPSSARQRLQPESGDAVRRGGEAEGPQEVGRFSRDLSIRATRTLARNSPPVPSKTQQREQDQLFTKMATDAIRSNPEVVRRTIIPAMSTPTAMRVARMPALPIVWAPSILMKVFGWKHQLSNAGITPAELNDALRKPAAVLQSERANDEYEVYTSLRTTDDNGVEGPLMVVIKADALTRGDDEPDIRVNTVMSAYVRQMKGPDGVAARLKKAGNIRYMERERVPAVFGAGSAQSYGAGPKSPAERDFQSAVEQELSRRRIPEYLDVLAFNADNYRGDMADFPMYARQLPIQGNVYTLPARSRTERASNLFGNEVSRVTAVQKSVAEQGGLVTPQTNVTMAQSRYYSSASNRMDRFRRTVVEPLIKDAADQGITMGEIAAFLYAASAEARNIQIANINNQFPDGGSGMTTADARAYLWQEQARPDYPQLKRLADRFQAITRSTQRVLLDAGLVDQPTLSKWNATNAYYVPMRGFEVIDENGKTGAGRFDPKQEFTKRALGRSSRAGQIIENILKDHEDAIVLAEKNAVRKTLLKFVLDNPDDTLWEVDRVIAKRAFYKNAGLASPLGQAMGEVRYTFGPDDSDQRTIGVRVRGKVYNIFIKDPAMLTDLQGRSILESAPDDVKRVLQAFSQVNRTLGKLYTAFSPAFTLINATRDLQTATINTGLEQGVGKAALLYKNIVPAAWAVWRAERTGSWTGAASKFGKYYEDYRADGGKVGFIEFRDLEDRQKEVLKLFQDAQASMLSPRPSDWFRSARKLLRKAEDLIMDINGAIEGASRLAAYAIARESGKSREEAVELAKNVTTDFNKRGKLAPIMSSFYLFYNPSVQGARNIARLLPTKRGAAVVAALASAGIIVGLMSASGMGDDDEPFWDKPSNEAAKKKNLVFFDAQGNIFTVPLPYGWGYFVVLGYALADLSRGKSPLKVAKFLLDAMAVHFSPLGDTGNIATFLAPTFLDPVIVTQGGRRENDTPLMPPESTFGPKKPDSERYWTATHGTFAQEFASWVNTQTGGNKVDPGGIDVSPETLKYWFNFVTGGPGTFVKDVFQTVDLTLNVGSSAPIEKNTLPFLRSFYRTDNGRSDLTQFIENRDEALRALGEAKAYYETDKASILDRLSERSGLAQMGKATTAVNKALGVLRKEEIALIDDEQLSKAEKYERKRDLDERRRQLYVDFNREFHAEKRAIEERKKAGGS